MTASCDHKIWRVPSNSRSLVTLLLRALVVEPTLTESGRVAARFIKQAYNVRHVINQTHRRILNHRKSKRPKVNQVTWAPCIRKASTRGGTNDSTSSRFHKLRAAAPWFSASYRQATHLFLFKGSGEITPLFCAT